MTAKHIGKKENLSIRTLDGDLYGVVKAVLDPDDDLAKLYIEQEFDEVPAKIVCKPIQVRENLIVSGTPYEESLFPCFIPGVVVKNSTSCPLGKSVIATTIDSGPGCSGCGVFDESGNLRAIHVGSIGRLSIEVSVEEWNEPCPKD
jgi:hypothetical protein